MSAAANEEIVNKEEKSARLYGSFLDIISLTVVRPMSSASHGEVLHQCLMAKNLNGTKI